MLPKSDNPHSKHINVMYILTEGKDNIEKKIKLDIILKLEFKHVFMISNEIVHFQVNEQTDK